jgi:hypothetical protein
MTTAIPEHPSPARRSFPERILGALRLDAATYDEIEHDESALGQAAGVVALAAVAAAIGSAGSGGGSGAVGVVLGAMMGWLISTGFIWVVGVHWMKHTSDYRELLRTLGFANAPNLLAIVGGIPVLGALAVLVAGVWSLAAFVVAARQALDVTTGRALWICFLAVLVNAACVAGLMLLLGGLSGSGSSGAIG